MHSNQSYSFDGTSEIIKPLPVKVSSSVQTEPEPIILSEQEKLLKMELLLTNQKIVEND